MKENIRQATEQENCFSDIYLLMVFKKHNMCPLMTLRREDFDIDDVCNAIMRVGRGDTRFTVADVLNYAEKELDFDINKNGGEQSVLCSLMLSGCEVDVFEQVLRWGASPNVHTHRLRYPLHHIVSLVPTPMFYMFKSSYKFSASEFSQHIAWTHLLFEYGAIGNVLNERRETPFLQLLRLFDPDFLVVMPTEVIKHVEELIFTLLRHGAIVDHAKVVECVVALAKRSSKKSAVWFFVLRGLRAAGLKARTLRAGMKCRNDVWSCDCRLCVTMRDFCGVEPAPESLQFACRGVIRNELMYAADGRSILRAVAQLPLPGLLRDYVSLGDLDRSAANDGH